jgi:hypothetical protein
MILRNFIQSGCDGAVQFTICRITLQHPAFIRGDVIVNRNIAQVIS